MPLSSFHPIVARWFQHRFGKPTSPQRQGWEAIRSGQHTLISAPTGSGKTLAAFLHALDQLFREGLEGALPDETRVVYVSPLKALSADIHLNLAEPRREIRRLAEEAGLEAPRITAAIRSGDTPAAERAAMIKKPPHILVTTPESLYLLLTAQRSREMLRTVRTVIVDEIHAVVESRRGAHLALTLERLAHVARQPVQRIGLSATVKPIEEVGEWLVGGEAGTRGGGDVVVLTEAVLEEGDQSRQNFPASPLPHFPAIVDQGHRRELDLALELPDSPLEAVMSGEVWEEIYQRLTDLIKAHRTTIVFVNTRRLAERVARHLGERLGEEAVTAHHGSLSKETRLDAEERLKAGKLQALVATASLELGIDIGHVDLVCQLGTPRRISTFLQRVGRSGHTVLGTPKGRLFPLTRDELVECTAIIASVHRGQLDRIVMREKPLDVLSQHIVAETAAEDWQVEELYHRFRNAYPYRHLERGEFDDVVRMLAQGFATRRGRRAALIHHDAINGRIRARRGARLLAITSGGAIPDNADYRVVLEPENTFIGTVNEDFAVESLQGDIFQLGNTSWRILQVAQGTVRVEDARGQPPSIPFWLGESPARSSELSAAVSEIRRGVEQRLQDKEGAARWVSSVLNPAQPSRATPDPDLPDSSRIAAHQLVEYLAESKRMLGTLPTQDTIVAERFFDEAGGMQLVIHAPFGSRVNRAWGLALRKRFCRQFNFELQAAATEDAVLLSLGPQHSFPLDTVFRFLHPETVGEILIQALLDAPMFGTHWRWNGNIALAIPRSRGGRKNPPQIQRMQADDLLAAAFPDAAACLENIPGDREIPDHPLVRQTIDDCVHEVMDLDGLTAILQRIHAGEIRLVARDLPEPSPLTHEILNARPYAFLDDAPLEERRTQAVYTRRAFEPSSADDLGALDPSAIQRVREEAWPEVQNADELHDALLTSGFLTEVEGLSGREGESWGGYFGQLVRDGRADRIELESGRAIWAATERIGELRAIHAGSPQRDGGSVLREDAVRELLRGRLAITGPITASQLASSLDIVESDADVAVAALEGEGVVLRGHFTRHESNLEWCDRRLLARIHRYTLNRLRAEIEPVSAADFMRFLFAWQRLDSEHRVGGLEGLASVISQLDGFELPAAAWESEVLSSRCEEYDPALLDTLCMTGRVAWGRLAAGQRENGAAGPIKSTPIALFQREHAEHWLGGGVEPSGQLSSYAQSVKEALERRGASFFHELVALSGLLPTQVEQGLAELAGAGLITSDSFAGLRALITPSNKRKPLSGARRRVRTAAYGIESAGRWSLLVRRPGGQADGQIAGKMYENDPRADRPSIELLAKTYLRRYGVIFKRLLTREAGTPPWRELLMVYRRLEARGEIRGGRFVSGVSGEQFALPEAVGQLRSIRRLGGGGQLVGISAADPLNLTGIVTPGERVPALISNRILYRDGVPVLGREAGQIAPLAPDIEPTAELVHGLVRKHSTPQLRSYLGMTGAPAASVSLNRPPGRRRSRQTETVKSEQ
ncbi:MAG TPA: DEAD/DEAH box helicase [Gemmatimonadales bacterium]|nr:DEAD/DEAH box helicase [Gemmatimonadales bacterium]